MKIDVFALLYNEERILRDFIEYYNFANITLYDNESTDNSIKIVSEYKNVTINKFYTGNEVNDYAFRDLKNNMWKLSKADWAFIVDCDEFVYSDDLLEYLESIKEQGYTIIQPEGYDMVSEFVDGKLIDSCRYGVRNVLYSKCCIINPLEIKEINYSMGAHFCHPIGNVKLYEGLKLLHYRFTNWEYLLKIQSNKRLRSIANRSLGMGTQHGWSDAELLHELELNRRNSVKVF